jgi:mannitol-1-phosphate/altronate dehydrogenase
VAKKLDDTCFLDQDKRVAMQNFMTEKGYVLFCYNLPLWERNTYLAQTFLSFFLPVRFPNPSLIHSLMKVAEAGSSKSSRLYTESATQTLSEVQKGHRAAMV